MSLNKHISMSFFFGMCITSLSLLRVTTYEIKIADDYMSLLLCALHV